MAFPDNGTKLADLFDPEVVADLINKKLTDLVKFSPLARVDSTLVGRPGSTITLPSFKYIGDATDVAEGAEISVAKLEDSLDDATIKKIGKGVEISDEAILCGFGDPLGEAVSQEAIAIAAKLDNDMLAVLADIDSPMVYEGAAALLTADDIATALVLFGEDIDGEKVILVSPAQYAALRKADDWCPASEIAAQLIIKGTVGMIHGCQVVVSNKLATSGNAYIVKPGALALYLKRDVNIEFERYASRKSTGIFADKLYACHLFDASKAIKLTVNPS